VRVVLVRIRPNVTNEFLDYTGIIVLWKCFSRAVWQWGAKHVVSATVPNPAVCTSQHKLPPSLLHTPVAVPRVWRGQQGAGANMWHNMRVIKPRTDGIWGLHDAMTTIGSSTVVIPCSFGGTCTFRVEAFRLLLLVPYLASIGLGIFCQPYQLSAVPWTL
jgi:hypothetical protein